MDAPIPVLTNQSPLTEIVFAAAILVIVGGCDVSDGLGKYQDKLRAKRCEQAGVTGEELKTCGDTKGGHKRVMEPIEMKRKSEKGAAFNTAMRALQPRAILREKYTESSLEILNSQHHCCLLTHADDTDSPKHPLFGKRFKIPGQLRYHPTDYENKIEGYLSLEDETGPKTGWYLDVDSESLTRQERSFIRANCIDDCRGKFFGVIGRIDRGDLSILGLQIEYMELDQRSGKAS